MTATNVVCFILANYDIYHVKQNRFYHTINDRRHPPPASGEGDSKMICVYACYLRENEFIFKIFFNDSSNGYFVYGKRYYLMKRDITVVSRVTTRTSIVTMCFALVNESIAKETLSLLILNLFLRFSESFWSSSA